MENQNKEEYAKKLADHAERALKILKICVLVTAVSAVLLCTVAVILLVTVKGISAAVLIGIALGIFVALLAVLACVFIYVRGKLKKIKELDGDNNL